MSLRAAERQHERRLEDEPMTFKSKDGEPRESSRGAVADGLVDVAVQLSGQRPLLKTVQRCRALGGCLQARTFQYSERPPGTKNTYSTIWHHVRDGGIRLISERASPERPHPPGRPHPPVPLSSFAASPLVERGEPERASFLAPPLHAALRSNAELERGLGGEVGRSANGDGTHEVQPAPAEPALHRAAVRLLKT